jgi:glycosyltransferase involved in cell wall biosynthesis
MQPEWLESNVDRFDLVHVHFGLESLPVETVVAAVDTLHRLHRPFVFTVHDLENPQLADQSAHRQALDAVIPAADRILTLTQSAADEILLRWRRRAIVVAHPTLLPDDAALPPGTAKRGARIGVHLRDLRPNIDGVGTVATLVRAIADLRAQGAEFDAVIRLNERVRDEANAVAIASLVEGHDGLRLERGARLDDAELAQWIADLDACVLPYRHGTHSGWAELCFDLSVPVIGPRVGHVFSQHPAEFFAFEIGEPSTLVRAILDATAPAASVPGSRARIAEVAERRRDRLAQRERVREAHAAVYHELLTASSAA